jgi:hypothetical protein
MLRFLRPRCGFVLPMLAALGAAPAQTTVTLQCAADNTLYETIAGDASNGAGVGLFVGLNAFGSRRRAVLRFDVAAGLPAGAKVLAAQLNLNVVQSTSALPLPITGHRLTTSWGEGTSVASGGGGGGGPAATGDATWLHRFWNTSFWITPGGDFAAAPSFGAAMPPLGPFSTNATREAAADVQAWLDTPSSNYGWVLRTDEVLSSTAHRIDSRESTGQRPTLTVTYLLPGQSGSWGQGCPVGAGNFTSTWFGAPVGGTTIQIAKTNAPTLGIGVDFFALALDPVGAPLLPGCTLHLPLAELIPGGVFLTDAGGGGSSPFTVPVGYPGFLIDCQAVVLDNNPLGFVVSNAALVVLQ